MSEGFVWMYVRVWHEWCLGPKGTRRGHQIWFRAAVWVLGPNLGSSARIASVLLNGWAIFPAPVRSFLSRKNKISFYLSVLFVFFSFVRAYLINTLHKHDTFIKKKGGGSSGLVKPVNNKEILRAAILWQLRRNRGSAGEPSIFPRNLQAKQKNKP